MSYTKETVVGFEYLAAGAPIDQGPVWCRPCGADADPATLRPLYAGRDDWEELECISCGRSLAAAETDGEPIPGTRVPGKSNQH